MMWYLNMMWWMMMLVDLVGNDAVDGWYAVFWWIFALFFFLSKLGKRESGEGTSVPSSV
jgi:hypothetical protein